ncbi:hypothetical protein CUMW_284310 [Citrus unshiu]|uniref:Uncharacterized protein n=1 Tax=Citrus unshiu TaxID=55188 RepID=A0A2H5N044_CITUN|nr:hypothetical protein CUMW_284310 [Citrus unshiu]
MAKAKLVFVLLVAALFSISIVMATETQNHLDTNAHHSAQGDVARRSSTNPACSSVKNAVPSASASLRGSMGTRLYALATITGRPSAEDPNAPKILPVGGSLKTLKLKMSCCWSGGLKPEGLLEPWQIHSHLPFCIFNFDER